MRALAGAYEYNVADCEAASPSTSASEEYHRKGEDCCTEG